MFVSAQRSVLGLPVYELSTQADELTVLNRTVTDIETFRLVLCCTW